MSYRAGGISKSDVMQAATPAPPSTGGTVTVTNTGLTGLTVVNPAGTLATLSITLPADANSTIGQVERIAFLKSITALTINGATTILGAPVSAVLGDNIGFQKVAANTWTRMS